MVDVTAGMPKRQLKRAAQHLHQGAQRSQTLMRSVVKKPPAAQASRLSHHLKPKKGGLGMDIGRASRAKSLLKSPKISRYSPPPAHSESAKPKAAPTVAASAATPVKVMNTAPRPLPSMVTSASHYRLERLLDHALASADAHKQLLRGQRKRSGWRSFWRVPRWASLSILTVAVLTTAGYAAWQNLPQLSLRLAAMRSEVSATVPSYSPSGYDFSGPAAVKDSAVLITYKSAEDAAQNYTISQQASKWDSTTLLSNFVNPADQNYQTSQVNGKTVYIYGDGRKAAWVSDGKLYNITSNANIDSEQLLKIAEGF